MENKAKEKPAASILTVHMSNSLPIHFPSWDKKLRKSVYWNSEIK